MDIKPHSEIITRTEVCQGVYLPNHAVVLHGLPPAVHSLYLCYGQIICENIFKAAISKELQISTKLLLGDGLLAAQ